MTLYRVESVKRAARPWVGVDGGMSDNLRPMLYGSRYEAAIVDRMDERGEPCTLVGKHCESGDVLVDDAHLPDPRPGDVVVTPVTGAYGHAMANNYNGVPRPPVIFCSGGDARVRRAPRDATRTCVPETFRVGLLGHGTVGAAFARLLEERADAIVPVTGLRPALSGVLTRSRGRLRGDPRGLRPDRRADGRDRAGARVRAARDAGRAPRGVGEQAAALRARRGAVGDRARARRRSCASRARWPASCRSIRVLQESLAAAHVERVHGIVNGTTNYILSEMARAGRPTRRRSAQAQALGYAEADPTEDVNGKDAAAKMAILARLAFSTRRCTSTRSATRGSSTSRPTTSPTRRSSGWG